MTKAEIPSYVGRFRVKKDLTAKLNYGDWLIYRDPENGMYLYSPSLDEEINPMYWNITVSGWTENIRQDLINQIKTLEMELEAEKGREPFDMDAPLIIHV